MKRINMRDELSVQSAERFLKWIIFSARPLKIQELQAPLTLYEPYDDTEDLDEDALTDEEISLHCEGLVETEEDSNIVHFIHYTTQEYFDRVRQVEFPRGHIELATQTLQHFGQKVFAQTRGFKLDYSEKDMRWPLYDYCAFTWHHHVKLSRETSVIKEVLRSLNKFPRSLGRYELCEMPLSSPTLYGRSGMEAGVARISRRRFYTIASDQFPDCVLRGTIRFDRSGNKSGQVWAIPCRPESW